MRRRGFSECGAAQAGLLLKYLIKPDHFNPKSTDMPYLDLLSPANQQALTQLRQAQAGRLSLDKKGYRRFHAPYLAMRHLRARHLDLADDIVQIGRAAELVAADRQKVYEGLRCFMPWRKGPFNIFGIDIDAEWRSERKWNRLRPALPDLTGKVVADIGCNNGYYMFRMAHHRPRWVIGFEPCLQHYYAGKTLLSFAGLANLAIEPLGVEHLGLFQGCFDIIFLMGIIYHRPSPLAVLKEAWAALRPGGVLMVESQAIAGDLPYALFPERRYAKVPGTYFVPTPACLKNWLIRAGFSAVEIFATHPMSSAEQRRTDWMTFESYADFIDPDRPELTVEGYPAPIRAYLKGIKQG